MLNIAHVAGSSHAVWVHPTSQKETRNAFTTRKRLSFKEQQELTALPATIERLEREIEGLHQSMAQPGYYQRSGEIISQERARLVGLEGELAVTFSRWEHLEQQSQDAMT